MIFKIKKRNLKSSRIMKDSRIVGKEIKPIKKVLNKEEIRKNNKKKVKTGETPMIRNRIQG